MIIHTHRHSEFSLLDGTGTAVQYAEKAAELGQPALALTDHGTLSGALHHYTACKKVGISPILGVEAYYRPNRLQQNSENKEYYHLVLLAKNLEGWHNLIRITSEAYQSGFYYKPCIDLDLLKRFHRGLIVTTACISSYIGKSICKGDDKGAMEFFKTLSVLFGEDFFVELMPHDIPEQRLVNIELTNLANNAGVPLLATVDAHYPYREWADTQDVLLMIATGQSHEKRRKKKEAGEDTYGFDSDTLYLMSEDDVRDTFGRFHPDMPTHIVNEAIANTVNLFERCEGFEIDKKQKAPRAGADADYVLHNWIEEGLKRIGKDDSPEYRERVKYELDTLKRNQSVDYFVIVGDMCRWALEQGIVYACRGSAAGSLISYLIRITNVDPIAYGLLFERFMNPDRKGTPDIDVDIQSDRRAEVKNYLAEKWGRDHVADVVAHQTYAPRACLQGVSRVFDLPYNRVTTVTSSIDEGTDLSLTQLRDTNQELLLFSTDYPEVWKHACRIEGQIKTISQHAGGVVITDRPISEYMPTMRGNKSEMMTAWGDSAAFSIISDYGYMKIDILGVKGLTKQQHAIKLIEDRTGEVIHLDDLPVMYDPYAAEPEVLQAFTDGLTLGVFQFETRTPTQLMRRIKPDWIGDLAAVNALNRPGPLSGGVTHEYADRKHGRAEVYYYDEKVQAVLEETYGIIAYQEQIMEISKQLGGFTGGQADDLRKAISKEYRNGMEAVRQKLKEQGHDERWKRGTEERGISKAVATEIWRLFMGFGGYGFNKSHSVVYGLQAYKDMWLKVHYPAEFYAATLTLEKKSVEKQDRLFKQAIIREARLLGVEVLGPDVNKSGWGFTVDDNIIRFGLRGVKNMGDVATKEVIAHQPYRSYDDFLERVPKRKCNSQSRRFLEMAGGFDNLGGRANWTTEEFNEGELVAMGICLTHVRSFNAYVELVDKYITTEDKFDTLPDGTGVTVGGEIVNVKQITTKNGAEMGFFQIVYGTNHWSCTAFPSQWVEAGDLITSGAYVMVRGRKDIRDNGRVSILADNICSVEELAVALSEKD